MSSPERQKIIRCPVLLLGGPRGGERIHVPPDTVPQLRVVGRSEGTKETFVRSKILRYALVGSPSADRVTDAVFIGVEGEYVIPGKER